MPGFNTSTRKEDLSLRLRAQNLKNARDQTKRLEEDNRKMEERLKELKTAMKREKELRERQGAGFWGRGQPTTGSLTHYASEVLQNKAVEIPTEGKIKKVKILRDEPIGKPKQIGPPGTVKYIAQRKLPTGATPRDKQKGTKCGQCEDRTATLSCIQCSEIYCPGCFAAFHLKGALKQHRSVPLSAAGPRVCMSADVLSPRGGQAASGLVPAQPYSDSEMNGSEAAGASPSHTAAPKLLQGEYDESQSAASFQAALKAWRQGEQPMTQQSARLNQEKPASSPTVAVDESIGTSEETPILDIKFKSSLSYAEKLMLKKHLRMKLAEIPPGGDSHSPGGGPGRQTQAYENMSPRSASQLHSQGSFFRSETPTASDEDGHVDFQSLFEVVAQSRSPDKNAARPGPSLSEVSIVDLFSQEEPAVSEVPIHRPAYIVKEVSPLESWRTEHLQQKNSWTPALIDDGYTHLSTEDINVHHHNEENPELDKSARNSSLLPISTSSLNQDYRDCLIISELPGDGMSTPGKENYDSSGYQYEEEFTGIEDVQNVSLEEQKISKPPAVPASVKSHTRRAMAEVSKVRRASSRASSRAGMDGYLTKVPSEALKSVVQMMQLPQYSCLSQDPLESFFLVGVKEQQPEQIADRVITPFRERNKTPRAKSRSEGVRSARQEKEAIKISNRLYQMAPRSWHPETSLSSAVPLNEIRQQEETTLSFSYSKQMSGQGGIDWHRSSSHSVKDTPECDIALESGLLFGDELFVADATAAANSISSAEPSSCQKQGDIHSETYRNAREAHSPRSPQTTKSHGSRRFHNITTPVNRSDIMKELKITPVPPNSTSGHRLHPEFSKSTLGKSKHHQRVPESEQASSENLKQNLNKSKTFRDEEKPFRNTTDSFKVTNSLNKSSPLKSKSLFSRDKPNQSPLKTNTTVVQETEVKTTPRSSTKTSLEKPEMSDFRKNFNKMLRDQKVDSQSNRRPNSSVIVSAQGENGSLKKSSRTQRPNSSSGGKDSRGKQQVSPKSGTDTVVSDMLKSRVQEDGWINSENEFSNDYDDGDHLTARCLVMQNTETPVSHVKKSEVWETDVQSFTAKSVRSKSGRLQTKATSARGDCKKASRPPSCPSASRPPSCRSTSAMSQKSGRTSRAIVVDGDDLSCYDSLDASEEQNIEDRHALEQLEWELASNTGRLTADGKTSHIRIHGNDDLESSTTVRLSSLSSEKDFNVAAKLLEDEKQAARNVEDLELKRNITVCDIDEVKALR